MLGEGELKSIPLMATELMFSVSKYLKVWWRMTLVSAKVAFSSRLGFAIFLIGKILRFLFFSLFLFIIMQRSGGIGGYNPWQIFFFFISFNIVDITVQFLLREVYRFRSLVLRGNFDFTLLRPMSPLFRSLFGGADIGDLFLLIILLGFTPYIALKIGDITIAGSLLYLSLLFNSFIIALSFHVITISVGVLTTEVENTLWLYRDISQMGRVPIDIYLQPLRSIITFAIPVGIMMTYPSYALMGILSFWGVIISFTIGTLFLIGSVNFWKFSLKRYSSASS